MFQVMIHTQSTERVVNSQAFWIGIVFMPSWVPPSSIETRVLLCSWLLLQCYRYQDQEVQAYQKQLFKVQIKYHVGRVKLLQLPMSTYWILVADHLTWGRQQRNPFYTTIFWKLKVPATKRIDCVRIEYSWSQHFFEQFIWIFHALLKISTHYEIATSGVPKNQPFGPAGFDG